MKYIDPFVLINVLMIISGIVYYVFAVARKRVRIPTSTFLGVLILVLATIITGFTIRAIYGVDILATIMLFVPPLFYTYMYSKIHDTLPRHLGVHFLPGLLSVAFFMVQPIIYPSGVSWETYFYVIVISSNTGYTVAAVKLYIYGANFRKKAGSFNSSDPLPLLQSYYW